ncbi:hypothetical protein Dimus_014163 [Dionaea muscipula]
MPTFTAVALDRLLEPGASKSAASNKSSSSSSAAGAVPDSIPERRIIAELNGGDATSGTRRQAVPHPKLARRDSTPVETERRPQWQQISPALYATPETTPLPDSPISDSPSAFPPSPYIVNHKRRGPRLMKSFSEQNVASNMDKSEKFDHSLVVNNDHLSDKEVADNEHLSNREVAVDCSVSSGVAGNGVEEEVKLNGHLSREIGGVGEGNGVMVYNGMLQLAGGSDEEGEGETEEFCDPQESLSYTSYTDAEDNHGERSGRMNTPRGEFFDAWEELSSDCGQQSQHSIDDFETELRDMRLSLLTEIEKRKQAEEALNNMQNQWQMLRQKMSDIGLVLPPDTLPKDGKQDADPAEEICRQIYLGRFMSESIGMEVAKAEAEAELEAHLETKNFEIARLNDRLHYYETMNREMSQRNQEAIERARHDRRKRKRRVQWICGSVGIAITLGSVVLAWSYTPGGRGSSSTNHLQAPEHDTAADC